MKFERHNMLYAVVKPRPREVEADKVPASQLTVGQVKSPCVTGTAFRILPSSSFELALFLAAASDHRNCSLNVHGRRVNFAIDASNSSCDSGKRPFSSTATIVSGSCLGGPAFSRT
jgi:hypothetical protein